MTHIPHSLSRALRRALLVRALAARALPVLALTPIACSEPGAAAQGGDAPGWFGRRPDGAAAVIEPSARRYQESVVAGTGQLRGTVTFEGVRPPDSTVTPTSHQDVCGQTLMDEQVALSGDRLAGAVVWLADARTGKRVPLARRFELVNARCRLEPRVQAALVGGTLNVRNDDPAPHRSRFVRQRTGRTIASVSQTDAGQVVPVDRVFPEAGLIEVRCDDHPWTRAWIAVFDHPYFAVTAADGRFTMDSVPPGAYRLVAWHPRLGRVERKVKVANGAAESVELELKGR